MKIVIEINLKKEPKCDTCGELAKNAKRKFTACGSQISWCRKDETESLLSYIEHKLENQKKSIGRLYLT